MHAQLPQQQSRARVAERHLVTLRERATIQTALAGQVRRCTVTTNAFLEGCGAHAQVLDKQKPGKREESKQYRYPVTSSQSFDDAGWESEVYAREEELGVHEGRILAREFKQRLAYNIGQVSQLFCTALLPASCGQPCLYPLIEPERRGCWASIRAIVKEGIQTMSCMQHWTGGLNPSHPSC